jgi:hypothetical protein
MGKRPSFLIRSDLKRAVCGAKIVISRRKDANRAEAPNLCRHLALSMPFAPYGVPVAFSPF